MQKIIIATLVFVFIAGAAKGVSDTLQFHYGTSVFAPIKNEQWWNPSLSWKNKYADYDAGDTRERFLGSRTLFVWTTDAWHLAQTMETLGWVLALLAASRLGAVGYPLSRRRAMGIFAASLVAFYSGFMLLWAWLLIE